MKWVYYETENGLWTAGFYEPGGEWHADEDFSSKGNAAAHVHYLNGGNMPLGLLPAAEHLLAAADAVVASLETSQLAPAVNELDGAAHTMRATLPTQPKRRISVEEIEDPDFTDGLSSLEYLNRFREGEL